MRTPVFSTNLPIDFAKMLICLSEKFSLSKPAIKNRALFLKKSIDMPMNKIPIEYPNSESNSDIILPPSILMDSRHSPSSADKDSLSSSN